MFSASQLVRGVETIIEYYNDYLYALGAIILDWHEIEEGATFFVKDENGKTLVTIVKPEGNVERAVVVFADGKVDVVRVRYILDGNGKYLRTEEERVGLIDVS